MLCRISRILTQMVIEKRRWKLGEGGQWEWVGGKRLLRKQILKEFPQEMVCYMEVLGVLHPI